MRSGTVIAAAGTLESAATNLIVPISGTEPAVDLEELRS